MKRRLEALVPVGLDPHTELRWFAIGMGVSALYSIKFLFSFFSVRGDLLYQLKHLPLQDTQLLEMPHFWFFLDRAYLGFLLLALCMPAVALFHYLYHYQGSRSIYLMRPLPDRWELLRRCIALPLCGALAALLTGLLITLLWAGIYLLATPRELLSPLWYL